MNKKIHYPLDKAALKAFVDDQEVVQRRELENRKLLDWLSDDATRAELFRLVNLHHQGALRFYSRDSSPRQCLCAGIDLPLKHTVPGFVPVTLVTQRARIKDILKNADGHYSSRIYAELGGGNFMLALDPGAVEDAHRLQREAFGASFPKGDSLKKLAFAAIEAAAVNGLQSPVFDLAAFAEQAGMRCVQMMMGYAARDYIQLEPALRAAYKGLVYQVHGRHFCTDPTLIAVAQQQMGALLARTSALIDAYAAHDEDALEGCEDHALPSCIEPVLKKLATLESPLNGEQRAILALGAAIGTVGNVQAAVCIAIKFLHEFPVYLEEARRLASSENLRQPPTDAAYQGWVNLIAPALRANPPIPFLPRLVVDPKDGKKTGEVLLALGGGTATYDGEYDDSLVWGLPIDGPHNCAGKALAWPLIVETVRQVMGLPGLAQGLDPLTGKVKGLEKTRGFACDQYLFSYRIDKRRAQTSLNVAMPIKAPISENAVMLRNVIRAGAPRIERLLRESRHVHFAWFEIVERDSVLVLHTVYDGPFGAYLQHFALEAGDLFDVLCRFIEDPPPLPVRKYPNEFAAHLLRYNRAPAAGYFFSAYPRSEVATIVRRERLP